MYAIVDIETTGGYAHGNRIVEIAIFLFDGKKVTDKFHSLIDPGIYIPPYISSLTGINDAMVESAPTFEQLADDIYRFTEGKIFVAHNANFDYSFIKQEFEALGINFERKKLCTVRLSRKIIPGMASYSLGNLCGQVGIKIKDRHRATGDAEATVKLLNLLLQKDTDDFIRKSLKGNSRETLLPANLPREQFDCLPEKAGVYYFFDLKGKVIYVGKAINIKKRVVSHFSGKNTSQQSQNFMNEIHGVSFELCGNELISLLFESHEIKKYWPKYNSSQKRLSQNFGIYQYEDMQGFQRLCINKISKIKAPVFSFQYEADARFFLHDKVREFNICPRLSGLQKTVCDGFCEGACEGKELVESYNEKVARALALNQMDSYAIVGKGRSVEESSIVVVEKGIYLGFGFLSKDIHLNSIEDFKQYIKIYKDNQDIQKVLNAYLRNNNEGVVKFDHLNSTLENNYLSEEEFV